MNNIKSVEVIKELNEITVGTVFSRLTNEDNFVSKTEHVGEDYLFQSTLTIHPTAITKANFKACAWFTPKQKTNKEIISALENDLLLKSAKLMKHTEVLKKKKAEYEGYLKIAKRSLENAYNNKYSTEGEFSDAKEKVTVYSNLIELIDATLAI